MKIELRTEGEISSGANTSIFIDGEKTKNVKRFSLEATKNGMTMLTIELDDGMSQHYIGQFTVSSKVDLSYVNSKAVLFDEDNKIDVNEADKLVRQAVYKAIDTEREYQEKVWSNNNKASGATNVSSFVTWMQSYLRKVEDLASSLDETPGSEGCEKIMDMMRKVVALGVACGELNGMPERK